jgi:tRNA(Arg) A34 adenosine deaminase TadA
LRAADKTPPIVTKLEAYLRDHKPSVKRGTEQYYAIGSLEQAMNAFNEGNYGIGSVVILKWKGKIHEFRDRNAMVTGYRLRDHAEARALDRAVVFMACLTHRTVPDAERGRVGKNIEPDDSYDADTQYLVNLVDGLHVFGTLEPCPMCMVMMLNVGVKGSRSLAKDGELKVVSGHAVSDGAAMATDDKFEGVPLVWQSIRNGQGLKFELYKADKELSDLALRIFLETREKIDGLLAGQK